MEQVVDVQRHKAMAIGQRLPVGLQQAQGRLLQPPVQVCRSRVDALAQDSRRGHAPDPQQAREGRIAPVGAHRLEVGLTPRQQRDVGGEDGRVGNGFEARPEQREQPGRPQQTRQRRQPSVAGQHQIGELILRFPCRSLAGKAPMYPHSLGEPIGPPQRPVCQGENRIGTVRGYGTR